MTFTNVVQWCLSSIFDIEFLTSRSFKSYRMFVNKQNENKYLIIKSPQLKSDLRQIKILSTQRYCNCLKLCAWLQTTIVPISAFVLFYFLCNFLNNNMQSPKDRHAIIIQLFLGEQLFCSVEYPRESAIRYIKLHCISSGNKCQ